MHAKLRGSCTVVPDAWEGKQRAWVEQVPRKASIVKTSDQPPRTNHRTNHPRRTIFQFVLAQWHDPLTQGPSHNRNIVLRYIVLELLELSSRL